MMLHQAALLLGGIILPIVSSQSSQEDRRQINGIASPGHTIHIEEEIPSLEYSRSTITVNSPIPITIEHYVDTINCLEGQQAVPADFGKVLVTSNCDTSQTQIIPRVTMSDGTSSPITITVELDGLDEAEARTMTFLDPSSYSAVWWWPGGFLYTPPTTTITGTPPGSSGGSSSTTSPPGSTKKCEVGIGDATNNICSAGEFCQLKIGLCNDKFAIHNGYCVVPGDMCPEIYDPVW